MYPEWPFALTALEQRQVTIWHASGLTVQLAGCLRLGIHRQVQSAGKDPQARMSGRVRSPYSARCSCKVYVHADKDSFEAALVEPIANQPDDILEGILVRFMYNLKPGNRNIK